MVFFGILKFAVQGGDRLLQIANFFNETRVSIVPTNFHARSMTTGLETRLGHSQWICFVIYSLSQEFNVLFDVKDFLLGLKR